MNFDMQAIELEYKTSRSKHRELGKWLFAIGTFGLGGLYLWASTKIVAEGEIGLRQTANGKMQLLPPGRHSNFPWESYRVSPQSLARKVIEMGPYKIITVDTGFVAETYNKGIVSILEAGQHLISDASHTFKSMIPVKQETKKLHEITAATSDNVALTMYADVRYQITEPRKAVAQIDDIETSIKEIAEISIAQIVSHHNLADFAPATSCANQTNGDEKSPFVRLLSDLNTTIKHQLAKLGITLINIGITSWKINDAALAHELGQGAVVKSQTQSKLVAADNAAKVRAIEITAESNAIIQRAEAESRGIKLKAAAYKEVGSSFQDNVIAQNIYQLWQQSEMVAHAKNANLFFSQSPTERQAVQLVATVPMLATASAS